MVNPTLVEKVLKDFVRKNGPITTKSLVQKTGFKKCIVNSVLHKNRHYLKTERSPLSYRNKKPIWSWSDEKVPLPEAVRKFRVLSTTQSEEQ